MSEWLESQANWRDYLQMCKPRVVLLMLLCAIVGMCLATTGAVSIDDLIVLSIGMSLVAGSAAVVNHVADAQIDASMARTRSRPIPMGRVSPQHALLFSAAMGIAGTTILYLGINPLTAWLNVASWVGYGLIYTLFLKRATPQNIVIGGLFGAAPPLFGWTAVTNSLDAEGILLVLIIFVWTPPHFWALALERKEDYRHANIPMLPITHGDRVTRVHILVYTVLLFIVSLLPFFIKMSGLVYLLGAIVLGSVFLYWAIVLLQNKNDKAPMATFRYSILYLACLFGFLLVDHYLVPAST